MFDSISKKFDQILFNFFFNNNKEQTKMLILKKLAQMQKRTTFTITMYAVSFYGMMLQHLYSSPNIHYDRNIGKECAVLPILFFCGMQQDKF